VDIHQLAKKAELFGNIVVVDGHGTKVRYRADTLGGGLLPAAGFEHRSAANPRGQRVIEKEKSRIFPGLRYVLL
jgi:hypothetical protein